MIDWDSLRFFAAFARVGSLAAAARLLGGEHATVARLIAALETSLNMKLVDRRGRAYQLTEDGVRVSEYAARMESTSLSLQRFAEGEESRIEGEVILSAPPAYLGTVVAKRLGTLRSSHPRLRLRLLGPSPLPSLARKETDIAIAFSRPQEQIVIAKSLGTLAFFAHASQDTGPLLAGAVAQYLPDPIHTVFRIEIEVLCAALVALLLQKNQKLGVGPFRLRLPTVAKEHLGIVLMGSAFFGPGLTSISFILSLGPKLIATFLGGNSPLIAGCTAFSMFLVAVAVQFGARRFGTGTLFVLSGTATISSMVFVWIALQAALRHV